MDLAAVLHAYLVVLASVLLIVWVTCLFVNARPRCFKCSHDTCRHQGFSRLQSFKRIKAKDCMNVSDRVRRRLGSDSLREKMGGDMSWISVLRGARFCLARHYLPMRVGAVALRDGDSSEGILVLGLEPWVLPLGVWRDSAIDHELVHCRQEHKSGAISESKKLPVGWKWLKLWWRSELEASLRSPIWVWTVVGPAVLPGVVLLANWVLRAVLYR